MTPKLYFKLCLSLFCTLTLFIPVLQAQETEPNNMPAQANTLALNTMKNGAINPAGDVDWYKVTTTGDGQLNLTFDNTGNADLKTLSVYDNDGTTLLATVSIGNGVGGLQKDGLAAGTFYIKVNGPNGTETGAYVLSGTLTVPARPNDAEPNNTFAQAVTLAINDSIRGHIGYYYNNERDSTDWIKLTTVADGAIQLTFDNTGYGDLKMLSLYDNDGATLLASVNVGNGVGGLQKDGLAAGTYYIKINGSSGLGNEFGAYLLADTLIEPPRPNDVEPDNVFTLANTLPLNDSARGHLGYYNAGKTDTTDWYKVTTTEDGLLQLLFDNTGYGDLKMLSLYDNDGTTLLASANIGNGVGGLQRDGLAAGTYYVKIKGSSGLGNEFGAYLVADTLKTLLFTNDTETNNIFSQAIDIGANDSTTGHLGYYYNGKTDTTDWYKVTLTSHGLLTIYYDNTGYGDLKMISLYDNDGTTLLASTNVGNGLGSFQKDNLVPGTYYIKIIGSSGLGTEFGGYSLKDNFTVALPVTFINFNGKLQNNEALLSWSTATEINNKGFEVQKSRNGHTFDAIGFVKGQGNSSLINNYNFSDAKVSSGSNYYRLKQIDINNQFIYSSIINIDYSKFDWAILGNPATENSWIQLQMDKKAHVKIQVFSIDGKIITSVDRGILSLGTYSIPLNLSRAGAGMYVIKLSAGNRFFTKKISK